MIRDGASLILKMEKDFWILLMVLVLLLIILVTLNFSLVLLSKADHCQTLLNTIRIQA